MKPLKQTEDFLTSNGIKSEADWVLIQSFCEQQYNQTLKLTPEFKENVGISGVGFVEWFNKAYSSGDIVIYENQPCIVSSSTLTHVVISVRISESGIASNKITLKTEEVRPAEDSSIREIKQKLFQLGLQYSTEADCLIEKYIPSIGSRIVFQSSQGKIYGILRELNICNNIVVLFCYWNSNTGEVYHSMDEKIEIESSVEFEIMTAGMYRRLKSELNKHGFDWNDKVGRVEPVNGKVPKGQSYYFFSDKMKICKVIEKEGRVSHEHWLAGNYFWSMDEALEAQGEVVEYLRKRLAKTKRGD